MCNNKIMDTLNKFIENKYIVISVFSFIIFFVLTPGNLFELNVTQSDKNKKKRKISKITVAIHSAIFTVIFLIFYYLYIRKYAVC